MATYSVSSSGSISVGGSSTAFLGGIPVEIWFKNKLKEFLNLPVFAVVAPQGTQSPFVVFRVVGGQFEHDVKGRVPYSIFSIDVEIVAKDYQSVATYAKVLRDKLQGIKGNMGTTKIHMVVLEDETDEIEPIGEGLDAYYYVRTCSYRVKFSL